MAETIANAHSVETDVRVRVANELHEIEQTHQVRILLACESGSRGWGFASKDSDYDVRFIYVHRLPWYLQIQPGRDVIERPISDALDISGWELRKALVLAWQSNPVLLEWLQSPIVYHRTDPWAQRLHDLALACFSPVKSYHHYVSMAQKTWSAYLQGDKVRAKKYFYALRPLLAARWVRERSNVPPMQFSDLLGQALETKSEQALANEINRLLDHKMRGNETDTGPRWSVIHAWIERELRVAKICQPAGVNKPDRQALDTFLYQAVLSRPS